ncbi:LysR family transcriptional regulator [Paenibacillus sambharensis]|uniref:LysR family transcriptional regulator n=1 Tax=Paenibacillus sambharensis TaxID=1803190 RepID=A0A2W1L4K7_9BACL|nr:LysR family transcriptional regulator [Paenibacillus sambharensis]PZD94988.1 LysR family transcriptional regulator [Paenibacillus sambharensis]
MNIEALEYFIKVYEKKSVSAAAKDLFITPQGISKTIKQLEMELEAELFTRGPRGMEATEAGELLHARAKHIRYLLEDIKKEISILSGKKGGLHIVVTYSASWELPADYLYGFSAIYPDIKIKLRESSDEYPVDEMLQDEVDIGIVLGPDEFDNCDVDLITTGEMVAVVSREHPLAARDVISITDLENEPLIVKATDKRREHAFVEKCLEQGFTPNVMHQYGSVLTAHRLCEMSGFVAVSIDFIEQAVQNDKLKVIRFRENIPQNIYLMTRKNGFQTTAISLFRNYIKDKSKS